MKKTTFDLIMNGSGYQQTTIAPGYKFISIINNSDNIIEVYQDRRTASDANIKDMLVKVPYYTQLTFPVNEGTEFTFIYTDGGSLGVKKANVIFADENLNINGVLGNPASGGAITIAGDGVGLAKTTQLPAALTGSGWLGVDVMGIAEVEVKNDAGNPINVTGNVGITGTAQVSLTGQNDVDVISLPPLASGTNNIGDVDVLTLPDVRIAAKTAVKVTAAGAGVQTVKATAGRVYAVCSLDTGISVLLKDNTTELWKVQERDIQFAVPITCATSIKLDFSGAGDAYVIYE